MESHNRLGVLSQALNKAMKHVLNDSKLLFLRWELPRIDDFVLDQSSSVQLEILEEKLVGIVDTCQ